MLELYIKLIIFFKTQNYKFSRIYYKVWKRVRGHIFSFNFFYRTIYKNWIIIYLYLTYLIEWYYLELYNRAEYIHEYVSIFIFFIEWLINKLHSYFMYLMDDRLEWYTLYTILLWIFFLSLKRLIF